MRQRILLATFVFGFSATLRLHAVEQKNSCEKNIQRAEAKTKKSFDILWQDVDSSVGVEFFLVVLKGNNRMPASSEDSSAEFYTKLLKGMTKTSKELADHGLKFDAKKLKKTEELISALQKAEKCSVFVSKN